MNLNGLDIEIIRTQRRKTLSINIERNGTVNVRAPLSLPEDEIRAILITKEYEIHKRITSLKELNKEQINRKFAEGQSFLYLGKSYNLKIVANQKQPLLLKGGYFLLSDRALPKAEEVFIHFYKLHGKPIINDRIAYFQAFIAPKPNQIKLLDLKTRWSSCTPLGNLNFNWKCVMAPSEVIDYLIVHELVHLIHHNHSRAFWDEVSAIIPNYANHIEWLRKNGVKMTLRKND